MTATEVLYPAKTNKWHALLYACTQQLEMKDIPLQTKYNISLLNSVSDCANFINLTFNYISFLKEDK